MDRKSLVILVAAFALIFVWMRLANKIWPPVPRPAITNLTASATNLSAATTNVATATTPSTNTPALPTEPDAPEQLVVVDKSEARYSFTTHGGGIKFVELKEYRANVGCHDKTAATNQYASVNSRAPHPIMAMTAGEQFKAHDNYRLTQTGEIVRAERAFANGLHVIKDYKIESNFLVTVTVRIQNRSEMPLTVPRHEWTVGTAAPASPKEDPSLLGLYWWNGSKAQNIDAGWFANRTLGCFPGTPRPVHVAGKDNARWAAVHNQFFAIALAATNNAYQVVAREISVPTAAGRSAATNNSASPWLLTTNDIRRPAEFAEKIRAGATPVTSYIAQRLPPATMQNLQEAATGKTPLNLDALIRDLNEVLARDPFFQANRTTLNQELSPRLRRLIDDNPSDSSGLRIHRLVLEETFPAEIIPSPGAIEAAMVFNTAILAPQQTMEQQFHLYAGPREYNTLARIGSRLQNELDSVMGYSGFFGWFAKALLLSMNGLHALGLSYALCIIAITVIIKLLFWPLTNASTKSMKRMAALQPQMKALQEKFKDDPAKMNRKLMEFMKEHKVSPLGGCLPMLLQLPVFFGFFTMIRSAIELRGARFLWVCDLSRPDTLFVVPGFGWPFNLLPLLMGVTMLWQARLTPPSPGMDPAQQKIMRYMPLMFLVILYNFSAGLTLYWTVQNLLTIAQMKLTNARQEPTQPVAPAKPVKPAAVQPRRKK